MKVVLIGSGSVATHLGLALQAKGCTISQVYSRNVLNAESYYINSLKLIVWHRQVRI